MLGLEDWESMLSETARLGVVDQGPGWFEPIGGVSGIANLITNINHSPNLSAYPSSCGLCFGEEDERETGKERGGERKSLKKA